MVETGYSYFFYLNNAFSCNNNYMGYTDNNGDGGRGNYELCYGLVLNMNCKNKLKIELSPTHVTFFPGFTLPSSPYFR